MLHKPILLPSTSVTSTSPRVSLFLERRDTPQIKRGANGGGPKEGSHAKLKYPWVVMIRGTGGNKVRCVSNFLFAIRSMFRNEGWHGSNPSQEGCGSNPWKSAGHMLEQRETRVLYYSRAARDTTLPSIFNTGTVPASSSPW